MPALLTAMCSPPSCATTSATMAFTASDGGAVTREPGTRLRADSAAATGDEGDLSGERLRHARTFSASSRSGGS
jgi:hypothetical protein